MDGQEWIDAIWYRITAAWAEAQRFDSGWGRAWHARC
jgi:hypothetical protein